MHPTAGDESHRAARLLEAQEMAARLFEAVEVRGLVRPGVAERQLANEIRDLAKAMFGITRHWHKRIVGSGNNTVKIYDDNPPATSCELGWDFGGFYEELLDIP